MLRTAIFASVLSLGTVLMLLTSSDANAATREYENTIEVSASGRVITLPDSVRNSFTVQTQAKTMAEAKALNAKTVSSVTSKLKGLGISGLEMETSSFSASPTYKYEKSGKSTVTGYQVYHSMNVKVEKVTDKDKLEAIAAKITDTPASVGATSVGSVSFYLTDNNPAFDEATAIAVKRARQKADVLAGAAGVKISGIYKIENNSNSTPMTNMLRTGFMPGAADASQPEENSPILAGPMEVDATVRIYYDYAD